MKEKLLAVLSKIRKSALKLKNLLPTALPRGMTEFESWASSIIDTYDFPNNDSVRFALATMILHSGPTDAYKSKHFFSLCVKASMAKQIAGGAFQDIKTRQLAAQKQVEATTPIPAVASSVQQQPIQN